MKVHREFFGDGSMRQIAPVSPALHLGADRVLVIGVGRQLQPDAERIKSDAFPTLAQIAGHALNSIFLDSLEVDLERLQRINRTIELIPEAVRKETNYPLHPVEFRVVSPSEELEKIAALSQTLQRELLEDVALRAHPAVADVRVLGATARARVVRYVQERNEWVDLN